MTTITIKIPGNTEAKLSAFVKELGGEVISVTSKKSSKKVKLLDEIKEGLRDVKNIRDGKSKSYTMSDLLNGE